MGQGFGRWSHWCVCVASRCIPLFVRWSCVGQWCGVVGFAVSGPAGVLVGGYWVVLLCFVSEVLCGLWTVWFVSEGV